MAVHEYAVTYNGLCKWSKKLFSTLGWMLIAKREERAYKLAAYLQDVKHLQLALAEKKSVTKDADRRADLDIMIKNAKTLHESAKALFAESATFERGTVENSALANAKANANVSIAKANAKANVSIANAVSPPRGQTGGRSARR